MHLTRTEADRNRPATPNAHSNRAKQDHHAGPVLPGARNQSRSSRSIRPTRSKTLAAVRLSVDNDLGKQGVGDLRLSGAGVRAPRAIRRSCHRPARQALRSGQLLPRPGQRPPVRAPREPPGRREPASTPSWRACRPAAESARASAGPWSPPACAPPGCAPWRSPAPGPSWSTAAWMSSEGTPRCRSSAASARPDSPRPWCRDSTQAVANMASSISFTSANRPSTASAASSGTPRRRSAAASCARVLGAAVSIRRQICRATASGPLSPPALAAPGAPRPGALE